MLIHRSPALTAIYNEIKTSDRNRVLDLGPMSTGCFGLFSGLSCKMQVEDLTSSLCEHIAAGKASSSFDVGCHLADYQKHEKFDVVLAWDLFNYMTLAQITLVFAALQPYCKPNTLLYMLRYVEKNIPAQPCAFHVKDKYLVEVDEPELKPREVRAPSTLQLLSAMPGYFMQDTLMGKMGMVPGITEHVLRFSPSYESKHLISRSELQNTIPGPSASMIDEQERIHISPSIEAVIALLNEKEHVEVLDLASSENRPEDFIVDHMDGYYRADIYSVIERSMVKGVESLNLSVLDYEFTRRFDVILAWDIFNFCSPLQLLQLDKALSKLCHSDTILSSFMYTGRDCPGKPSRFEVLDGRRVKVSPPPAASKSSGAITGVTLLRLLEGFDMNHSYAYREGMDRNILEYIFTHRPRVSASRSFKNVC